MTKEVNTILANLPSTIAAYTVSNADMSYTIVLNSRLNYERQLEAYHHEMNHIESADYDKKYSVDFIECYAHTNKQGYQMCKV